MEIKDAMERFSFEWALYFIALYLAAIISNQAIELAVAVLICALLSFFGAVATEIVFFALNRRLAIK